MGRRKRNLIGHHYGQLVVLKEVPRVQSQWYCLCTCGVRKAIKASSLTTGRVNSCGCLHRKTLIQRNTTHELAYKHPLYGTWKQMLGRCNSEKDKRYEDYGGRGIKVCGRWFDFINFIADMGKRPSANHSLDRINVNGHYEPSNCRWATKKQQANNKRKRVRLDQYTDAELLEELKRRKLTMNKPTIVCLCGSTKFMTAFYDANMRETLKGNIVLSVGMSSHGDCKPTEEQKIKLDELHKRKIDLASEVLILNVGGYVGESTRSEILYAIEHGKTIRWLEPNHNYCWLDRIKHEELGGSD